MKNTRRISKYIELKGENNLFPCCTSMEVEATYDFVERTADKYNIIAYDKKGKPIDITEALEEIHTDIIDFIASKIDWHQVWHDSNEVVL